MLTVILRRKEKKLSVVCVWSVVAESAVMTIFRRKSALYTARNCKTGTCKLACICSSCVKTKPSLWSRKVAVLCTWFCYLQPNSRFNPIGALWLSRKMNHRYFVNIEYWATATTFREVRKTEGTLNKWSNYLDIRKHRRSARIVQSYTPGGANVHLMFPRAYTSLSIPSSKKIILIGSSVVSGLLVIPVCRTDHAKYDMCINRPMRRGVEIRRLNHFRSIPFPWCGDFLPTAPLPLASSWSVLFRRHVTNLGPA